VRAKLVNELCKLVFDSLELVPEDLVVALGDR